MGLDYFRLEDVHVGGLGGSGTRWNITRGIGERLRHLSQLASRLATGCPGAASQAITSSLNPATPVPRHFAALSLNSRVLNNAYIATAIGLPLNSDTAETTIFHSARQGLVESGDGELV
jgi:hypothetical protein